MHLPARHESPLLVTGCADITGGTTLSLYNQILLIFLLSAVRI